MPRKPKSPCSYPGCPKLTDDRYCEKHKRLTNKNYNKYQRDPKSNKRYGRAWKRIRDRYVKEYPLCEECKKHGSLLLKGMHHIVPCQGGNEFQSYVLCKSCPPSQLKVVSGGGSKSLKLS